jgi:hypothetical protein
MTDGRKASEDRKEPSIDLAVSSSKSANGFALLAKRIAGITSNFLFTAIVLVAGLGIGRQILQWWRADAPRQTSAPQNADFTGGLIDPSRLHVLQFGDQAWSMARREFHGSREQAEKQLQRDCREQMAKAALPHDKPTEVQKGLLASLAKTSAIDADLPHWQLFAPDRKNKLILIGVKPPLNKLTRHREGEAPAEPLKISGLSAASSARQEPRPPELAQEEDIGAAQVVLWGMALPGGKDAWSLLYFFPSAEGGKAVPLLIDVPLPPKCRKMLSVQTVNGGQMVAFSGPGVPAGWRGHFEKEFAKGGWKPVFPWKNTASAWYAQYRSQNPEKSCRVDVHLYPDDKGGMTGLMIIEAAK